MQPPVLSWLVLLVVAAFDSAALDEIRARVVVQYYPWNQEDNSRGFSGARRNSKALTKVLNDVPGSDVIVTDEYLRNGVVLLECLANVPVLWDYEGSGYPSLATSARTGRKFKNFSDPSTYTYWAKVHLAEATEKNTGKYTCSSAAEPEMNAYFYLYVPGFSFFVPKSGLAIPVGLSDSYLRIPCAVSHPEALEVDLYKLSVSGHPELITRAKFDPKVGFTLDIKKDLSPWGTYICVGGNKTMTNSLVVSARPPKEFRVRVTVNSSFVPLDPRIKQHFICEALQNVTLEFSTGVLPIYPNRTSKITYEYNADSEFPFLVELEAEPREFQNHTLINCVYSDASSEESLYPSSEVSSNRILHSWEYSIHGNNKTLSFTYNETLEAFVCCTANSYVRPAAIYFVPCSTFQECKLRLRIDLQETHVYRQPREILLAVRHYGDPKSHISHELLAPGCIGVEQFLENHEGTFLCSLPPANQHETEENTGAFCSNCDGLPTLTPLNWSFGSEVYEVKIDVTPPKRELIFQVGQEIQLSCQYDKFHFSNGLQWAFQRSSGTLEILDSFRLKEGQKEPVRTWLLELPDDGITGIMCIVPLWFSSDWRNATIAIKVSS